MKNFVLPGLCCVLMLAGIGYLVSGYSFNNSTQNKPTEVSVSSATAPESDAEEASPFGGHVHALAVNGETGNIFLGARPVYRSSDDGKKWNPIPIPKLEPRANITSITIDPTNSQVMYATGHGIAVAKSTNGGTTWETKNEGLGGVSTESFTIDANDANKLYVSVLNDGLYRSIDGGESWGRIDDGPKNQEIRSLSSVNLPTGMGGIWLYAATDVGVIKSPDCFCGWDKLPNEGLPKGRVYSISADNNNPGTIYAGLRDGVYKTVDEGKTWRQITDLPEDAVVAAHPKKPNIVYAVGSNGRFFISTDAGETWESIS